MASREGVVRIEINMDQSFSIPALAQELINAGILKEQEKKREKYQTLKELQRVKDIKEQYIEEEFLVLILKKRGVIKDEPTESLFRNIAKHIPTAQIIELYTENSE